MQGLIYKDICLFFKSMEKKMLLIIGGCIVLLMAKAGIYAGLIASVMMALETGIQSILSFESDEKANWKKYQMAMPVSAHSVVASKYISVVYLLVPAILVSVIFNFISSMIYGCWNMNLYGVSVAATVILNIAWTAIGLPLTYWFGFRSAQVMAVVCVFPLFYFVKFFEDGPGMAALPDTAAACILAAFVIGVILFIGSYFLSVAGYSRKK